MKKCFAASAIVTSPPFTAKQRQQILGLVGAMAEAVIGTDYLHHAVGRSAWWPVPPKVDFHDANRGFASKTQYLAFLFDHNPTLDRGKAERLANEKAIPGPDGQLLFIPDFLSQDPPQQHRFYEVKPDSPDGTVEADRKMASIDAFMHALGLPYMPGDSWRPNRDFPFFTGLVFGMLVTVSFHYQRHATIQGVVVYRFCIGTRTFIPLELLLLILAIVIIVILFPEIPFPVPAPIPVPVPTPVPVPAAAGASALAGSVGASGANGKADTQFVQLLLNTWMQACRKPLLTIDGKVGPLTTQAILSFQREYLPGFADGRVDPDGPTLRALATLAFTELQREARSSPSREYLPSSTQFMPGEEALSLLFALARNAR